MRKGTISDWRDLEPAMRAMSAGKIPFEKFATLGRLWMTGKDIASVLEAVLPPPSIPARIVRLVKKHPGLLAKEIDAALKLREGATAEMCGRLRKRGQVRTVLEHNNIRVYPT